MLFYIYDVQKGKGYWKPDYKGYTHNYEEAGVYESWELPTYAGDCWIAIPQYAGKPNLKVVYMLDKDSERWD